MRRRPAFTLVELLVVVSIVVLVSAVTLPTVLPALQGRQVNESARILQAALAGARDSAIRHNAPRGIRLLPDKTLSALPFPRATAGQVHAANRIVPIEPAPDLTDSSTNGSASFVNRTTAGWASSTPPVFPVQLPSATTPATYPAPGASGFQVLIVAQAVNQNNVPSAPLNPPTNWFWNVRVGDRFRFHDSGRYYTVVGPMTVSNPEAFVNDGPADKSPYDPKNPPSLNVQLLDPTAPPPGTVTQHPEFLFLVNGVDDNGDGFTDEGFDGVDQNLNGTADDFGSTGPTGVPPEWAETEQWLGSQATADAFAQASTNPPTFKWVIARRPVVSPGAREVTLAGGAVIDLTSFDLPSNVSERSRLPVNALTGEVDVLLNQAGQVVPTTLYSSPASASMAQSFYHFWIADRSDVTDTGGRTAYPTLPVPGDVNVPSGMTLDPTLGTLKRDRFLVTLFARSGQVVTNSVASFDLSDPNRPYSDAQLGTREAK